MVSYNYYEMDENYIKGLIDCLKVINSEIKISEGYNSTPNAYEIRDKVLELLKNIT